jgi:hypothetical protein
VERLAVKSDDYQDFRAQLAGWLRERMAVIEEAILARIRALPDSVDHDPEFVEGLRAAVKQSVDYSLLSIEHGENWSAPIPPAISALARRAARDGASLEAVLRRYVAADRLMREFIMDTADRLPSHVTRRILSTQGPQFDGLVGFITAEYIHERERLMRSPSQHVTERVQQLLAGVDDGNLDDLVYRLKAWHIGMVVQGEEAEQTVRKLASELDRQILVVRQADERVWAWLGGRQRLTIGDIERWLSGVEVGDASLAVGEPHRDIEGWRLTHHEARAAAQVMRRRPQRLTRGSEVLLLAAVLENDALTESLLRTYLAPLDHVSDSGEVLRQTLRAYFNADCNAATAAAALKVNRHTVCRRLQKTEEALGRLLQVCRPELEIALRAEELWTEPR